MNEKQAKLLRYFERHSTDKQRADMIRNGWHLLNHKKKGRLTTWLKKSIVTIMAVKAYNKRSRELVNMRMLEGFITP